MSHYYYAPQQMEAPVGLQDLRADLCFPSCPKSLCSDFGLGYQPPIPGEEMAGTLRFPKKRREVSDASIVDSFFTLFMSQIPSYSGSVNQAPGVMGEVEVGHFFDVISMLKGFDSSSSSSNPTAYLQRVSGSRVDVDSLRGKYILVCCFSAPLLWDDVDAEITTSLSHASSELLGRRDDTETVAVVKMRPGWEHDLNAFRRFISAFPPNCLVFPFEEKDRCDFICQSLNFQAFFPACVFVCPEQKVLLNDVLKLQQYGPAEAFPYSAQKIDALSKESSSLASKLESSSPCSLHQLLGCSSSDLLLRIDINNDDDKKVVEKPISELEGKIVGLYLCLSEPMDLTQIRNLYEQCKDRDMEIVVVQFPDLVGCNRLDFETPVIDALREYGVSCWLLPYKYTVTRRLWRVSRFVHEDKLIILGPNGKYSDYYGTEILLDYHSAPPFPFTRVAVWKSICEKLTGPTLKSLLTHGERDYVIRNTGEHYSLEKLTGKYVILRLYPAKLGERHFKELSDWYDKVTAKYHDEDTEVVVVFSGGYDEEADVQVYRKLLPRMPCLVCPFDPKHSASAPLSDFMEQVCKLGLVSVLFDKEGGVCSVEVLEFLNRRIVRSPWVKNKLQSQVLYLLANRHAYFKPMLDSPNVYGVTCAN